MLIQFYFISRTPRNGLGLFDRLSADLSPTAMQSPSLAYDSVYLQGRSDRQKEDWNKSR